LNESGSLNSWLDRLPRTRFGQFSREVPAFRACGVAGFHLALVAVLAGGLVRGASLLVLGVLSFVCVSSFYVWAYVRRAITSREELVLLEHVWIALAAAAGTLRALGEPVLSYLDVIAVGLACFLAAGRIGCTLVGCCHGKPASIGVSYGLVHARDGFPRHLVHVRLLPVPAFEAGGLFLIGGFAFLALPFTPPGRVLAWFLGAYSVLRFGLEGLRGDRRPHLFGLSAGRWMAMSELVAAVAIVEESTRDWLSATSTIVAAACMVLVAVGFAWRELFSPARRLLRPGHVDRVRSLVKESARAAGECPVPGQTPLGASVAVSADGLGGLFVSLRLPDRLLDLPLLCALAARALPELLLEASRIGDDGRLLLLRVPELRDEPRRRRTDLSAALEDALYGLAVRQLQRGSAEAPGDPEAKVASVIPPDLPPGSFDTPPVSPQSAPEPLYLRLTIGPGADRSRGGT